MRARGDELLGQRMRRGVMIGLRADDAAQEFLVVEELDASWASSPTSPTEFTRMAVLTIGCGRMAGVHSTLWILAISAEFNFALV